MKTKVLYLFLLIVLLVCACTPGRATSLQPAANIAPPSQSLPTQPAFHANQEAGQSQPAKGGPPPQAAIAACTGKKEQDVCEFTSNKGTEKGICETVENQLACSPKHGPAKGNPPDLSAGNQSGQKSNPPETNRSAYNIEQAISDKAQGMTISFDALAFLTGDLGSDSFFPPGKVADFWGFQYLRDNDPSKMGHAGEFLTSAAINMLNPLTGDQRAQLVTLARSQVASINE